MFNILINPKKALKHPFQIFLVALVYSSISIFFSIWIFSGYSSIAMIFLTSFSCLYILQSAIRSEEKKEKNKTPEKNLLKEHSKIIILMFWLFFGFLISFSFWSFVLPHTQTQNIFAFQKVVVDGARSFIETGAATYSWPLKAIISNNVKVMFVSIIFSIFFGAGAIYILVWNASIMGYAIGTLAKETFGIIALPIVTLKYFLHGIPEMVSYLIASVAGGILYIAFLKGDFKKEKRKRLLIDSLTLIAIALVILIIAALIEVFISPRI